MAFPYLYTGGDNIQVDIIKTDGNIQVENLAVMFDPSDGVVKAWDTTDTDNIQYFLGVVWGYTNSQINIATGGSIPTSLSDGTYYANGSGVLSTTLGGSSFDHKVCEVVNGQMYVVPTGGVYSSSSTVNWGDIGGTLSDQSDLQSALDSKLESGDNVSELVNDAGYITSASIPTNTSDLINDGADNTSTYVEHDEIGAVATSNDYNDLDNLPTLDFLESGDNVSELVNDAGYLTSVDSDDVSVDDTDFVVVNSPTDLQDYLNQADAALTVAMNTGVKFGGIPSVDGGIGVGNTVSVTAGEGSILDITDAENPTYTTITWGAQSTIALDNTSPNITYWYFDDNSGVIKQTTTRPTFPERKGAVYLFRTVYNAGVISALGSEITQLQHTATAISAISEVLGPVNLFGNEPTNSSTNLKLKITSGKVYDYGANYFNSYIDPHAVSFATFDTGVSDTFRYAIQSGTIAVDETDIDVGNYNNSGVVTAIPGSSMRVGIHFVFRFSDTGNIRLGYGDDWYQNTTDALEAISSLDPRDTVPDAFSQAQLLGAIIVRKSETDLSNATFITANKFGELGSGSISSSGGGSYLEIANNLSDLASASTARTNLDVYSTGEVDALLVPKLETVATDATITGDGTSGSPLSVVASDNSPIGSVVGYRFSSIPAGYLLLDGSTYNVDDYPTLGALYGGIGGGTFDVDDWSDLPLWGTGVNSEGDIVGSDTVDLSHTHSTTGTAASNGAHTHTTTGTTNTTGSHTHDGTTGNDSSGSSKFILSILGSAASDSPHTHDFTTDSDGDHSHTTSGTAASNGAHTHTTSGTTDSKLSATTDKKPRRAHVNWIIKAL